MPLRLVTGPANAEKARVALDAQRAGAGRGALLVVPRPADVQAFRRELAQDGAVFGAQVVAFDRMLETMAARAGVEGRPLGALGRERLAAVAVAALPLRALGDAAATRGFPRALLALLDELEERRVEPGRWRAALRAWSAVEPERAAYAEDLVELYAAYRDRLAALGRRDAILHAIAALDALRLDPGRWGGSPVVFYGFDDFTPLQLDAVETLAVHVGADVLVTLTYEAGRVAFAARGEAFAALRAIAGEHVALPPRAEHYAPAARDALHQLERSLFEEAPAAVDPGGVVELLEGGGERAELELVADRVAALLDQGWAADEIAVVMRSPAEAAALAERVFGARGVPVAVQRPLPAGHTALGRAVVGLVRAALADGSAADLLAWLRAPGHLDIPALADRLEARARREGATTAGAARALWEEEHPTFPLEALDRLAEAARRGPRALCDRLAGEALRLLAAPFRGRAPLLEPAAALDARVAAGLRAELDELAALAAADATLWPDPPALADALARVEVPGADRAQPGTVLVTTPFALRARRVRALFLCRVQEGGFPAPPRPDPFLGDQERRALNAASGLRLRVHDDGVEAERYLLYAAVSRPTERLALSWHAADEDGEPRVPSLFVADVRDAFEPALWSGRARRALGAVEGAVGREGERPIGPLRHPEVLAALGGRAVLSASALETWASCPVRWFVERHLRPDGVDPDAEPLRRGGLAHAVLEEVLRRLCADARRLSPERLPEARALLDEVLGHQAQRRPLSVSPVRARAELRRIEADLWRELERHAHEGGRYVPRHFELGFGSAAPGDAPAVGLAAGELTLEGRIDRVDVSEDGARAIVVDYKGRSGAAQRERWAVDGHLQVGLYMLALRELLGVDAVGGLYQPVGARDARPRGLLLAGNDDGLQAKGADRAGRDEFDETLRAVQRAALAAAAELRAGRLRGRPETCGWKGGGCAYPSICRCEAE